MNPLPVKFDTWNQFYKKIITSSEWNNSHKIINFDGSEYTIDEIKSKCFDEIILILPTRDKIWKLYEIISYDCIDNSDEDWLYKLSHLI